MLKHNLHVIHSYFHRRAYMQGMRLHTLQTVLKAQKRGLRRHYKYIVYNIA